MEKEDEQDPIKGKIVMSKFAVAMLVIITACALVNAVFVNIIVTGSDKQISTLSTSNSKIQAPPTDQFSYVNTTTLKQIKFITIKHISTGCYYVTRDYSTSVEPLFRPNGKPYCDKQEDSSDEE